MGWPEVIGIIVGLVTVIGGAGKWLLDDWSKKSEELETLKAKNTTKALDRLEQDLREFRATVSQVQSELKQHGEKLLGNSSRLAGLETKLVESKQTIESHTLNLAGNVRQLIRSEIVELSKNAQLIRDKKNGKS